MSRLNKSQIKALPLGTARGDGGNLWIVSSRSGRKRWEFRYTYGGKRRCMGLGPWPEVSVEEARDKAFANRKLLIDGIDPLAEKKAYRPRRITTFKEVAEEAIGRFAKSWTGPKQEPQWRSSLERYAYPILGEMHVGSITPEHVRDVLEPIWFTKAPTAERVQNRIERILDFATVQKLRTGDNPARLKGNLEYLLGKAEKVEKHFAALPHADLVSFMEALRARDGMMARAHELLILTATRTSETAKAEWLEFDLDHAVWTIPAERMKKKHALRVPLSRQAVQLLKALPQSSKYVFPGDRDDKHITADFQKLRNSMDRRDITTHGFRSTFRDWVADKTSYPDVLAEKALAHRDTNKVQAAYRRSDMFEKRIPLMQDWADYCYGLTGDDKVVPIRGAR
ncbi:MAG: tyrosine-type recombinase/integrase [Sphingomicrobium sp.]